MDRRTLLRGGVAVATGAAMWPLLPPSRRDRVAAQAALLGASFDPAPFTLGVASGDPAPDSVVLWTRLAPDPLGAADDAPSGPLVDDVEVDWVLAADPRLQRVVARGTALLDVTADRVVATFRAVADAAGDPRSPVSPSFEAEVRRGRPGIAAVSGGPT